MSCLLALARGCLGLIGLTFICIAGSLTTIFSPRHPKHVARLSKWFRIFAPLLGVKITVRGSRYLEPQGSTIYIANHQNLLDILATSYAFPSNTVTIGKKSLLFVPFFGLLYWLSGNVLIKRQDRQRAYQALAQLTALMKSGNRSFWFFPEGTRSYGRGLLPFKQGPFRVAVEAQAPIVPICISNLHESIKIGRWNNGEVILEILPPITSDLYQSLTPKQLSEYCHRLMKGKLQELNQEIKARGKSAASH